MSRQKEKFLVLDTETANTIEQPIPYDIGWAICDNSGTIYVERSFIVAEVFCDMKDVMQSAYYAEKIPRYWNDIKSGKRTLASMWKIRKIMCEDIKKYKIKKIGAYNMAFDKRALNNLVRYVSKSWLRWWFPFGMEFFCIWSMACQTLLNTTSYIKFALQNGLVSEADNIQTSAEACYKFISNAVDFVESHTGLEDVRIEVEIMTKCFSTHKKMNKAIDTACWRLPQRKRKEIDLRTAFKSCPSFLALRWQFTTKRNFHYTTARTFCQVNF
ncbi:MAG: hypothetical protein IJ150_11945 [Bacteroidales bacterium]|nr:hypothetical protein [Bacteroidales bacterium]